MLSKANLKPIVSGGLTLVPGLYRMFGKSTTRGTDEARYCYSVWLRHLVSTSAHESPDLACVGELGPGDSIGIGLTALLTGAKRYIALDLVVAASLERNTKIFDELVELVRARTDIPDSSEYPGVNPKLDDYRFPKRLISDATIESALDPERIAVIRRELQEPGDASNTLVRYIAPWIDANPVEAGSISYLFSQAVLEHVDDLPLTYRAMYSWLRPGALMSHTIDYASHGLAESWNGHWQYGPMIWRIVRGSRPYLLNREPHATQQAHLHSVGFDVLEERRRFDDGGLDRAALASRYRNISDIDLRTRGAFVVARRPVSAEESADRIERTSDPSLMTVSGPGGETTRAPT